MKLINKLTGFVLMLMVTCPIAIAGTNIPQGKNLHVLYTQTAQYASFQPIPGSQKNYKLILHNVNPTTTWFTDRPVRNAGVIATSKFVVNWNKGGANSFVMDNPNASIVYLGSQEHATMNQQKINVFRISNPVYNAKMDILTYQVTSLEKELQITNQRIKDVALFIDSWCFGDSLPCIKW